MIMHEIKLGDVSVVWFGHASFMISSDRKIYIDPFVLPPNPDKADIVLVTHEHFDHCDVNNTNKLRGDDTKVFGSGGSVKKLGFGSPLNVGNRAEHSGIRIAAVEAYNINKKFHPRGLGIGFVVEIDGKKIYHAGDTDNIPEMALLKGIDLALLPVGGMYTMTTREAAEAAKVIKPKFLIPMHYNSDKYGVSGVNADPAEIAKLLVGKGIAVNILAPMV
jgi:L-ascorbate metabolism protein UlaG (beta-lactamase superfamily)